MGEVAPIKEEPKGAGETMTFWGTWVKIILPLTNKQPSWMTLLVVRLLVIVIIFWLSLPIKNCLSRSIKIQRTEFSTEEAFFCCTIIYEKVKTRSL